MTYKALPPEPLGLYIKAYYFCLIKVARDQKYSLFILVLCMKEIIYKSTSKYWHLLKKGTMSYLETSLLSRNNI